MEDNKIIDALLPKKVPLTNLLIVWYSNTIRGR